MWHDKKPDSTAAAKQKSASAEYGTGAEQWAWFKKTNIPIRDAAKNMNTSLGSLAANAITPDMQIALASGMVNEPEVHPKKAMTEGEIDDWIEADQAFTWFRSLSDEILILVLDRIYGSTTPEPFFRLKLASNLPTVKQGELYYPVKEFTQHCDNWLNMLAQNSQLAKSGWDHTHTDLPEVFLASIESSTLVLNQAKQCQLKNVHRPLRPYRNG